MQPFTQLLSNLVTLSGSFRWLHGLFHVCGSVGLTVLPLLTAIIFIVRLVWVFYSMVHDGFYGNFKKNKIEVDLFGKPEHKDDFCIWIDENPFEFPSVEDRVQIQPSSKD